MEVDEPNNDDTTNKPHSGSTDETFETWCRKCLDETTSVKKDAQGFFRTQAASQDTAMAQLIRALEPCFPTAAPVNALTCLEGALLGCDTLDKGVCSLLRRFLLPYVSPIVDNEDEDRIRDAGLKTIKALVPLLPQKEMLDLAKEAVEHRCVPDALGLMPRSRRSLCFQLLQTAATTYGKNDTGIFGSYCIQCLHGESDPRCLLQLLNLLETILPTPLPSSDNPMIEDLFEAASPYYPIQFSPPPNDVHGITRDDLCGALWNVLAKTPAATIALLLETLEDSGSASEQLEVLRDLEAFFLLDDAPFPLTDPNDVRHLSHSLVAVHERHCTPSASPEARTVADTVRSLARRIAQETEQASDTLFRAFVIDVTDQLTTTRAGAAYLVGLASTSSEHANNNNSKNRTWDICWKAGWTTTNVAVCGAWCAAARATGRSPLEMRYATAALTAVHEGISMDAASDVNRTPAIRAFESVLLASPVVEGLAWVERIRTSLQLLVTLVVGDGDNNMEEGNERQFLATEREAASLTLGAFLGCVLDEDHTKYENTFLLVAAVKELLISEALLRLLDQLQDENKTCYIHKTLSMIAKAGLRPMQKVVEPLLTSLPREIAANSSKSIVSAFDYLFDNTDGICAVAFQACDTEPVINALMGPFAEVQQTSFRMSNLTLPESKEELEVMDDVIENAYQSAIMVLRKGFSIGVTNSSVEKLMKSISMVLPPLRPADTVRLSLLFPLLSSALGSAAFEEVPQSIHEMVPHLADFSLSSENHGVARVHAARCLHACIGRFALPNTADCPGRELIKNKINQSMLSTSPARVSELQDALRLIALVGSAAALRGGTSTETAVAVTQFLVEIACLQSSQVPFMEGTWHVTLSQSMSTTEADQISVQAAESVGHLLTTDDKRLKLRKQRLVHCTNKLLQSYVKQENSTPGVLALTSQILCSAQLSHFSTEQRTELASLLPPNLKQPSTMSPEVLRVMLAAIVKLLRLSPASLNSNNEPLPLVAGLLRAFGTGHLQCQVLALEALASLPLGKSSEVKSAVANILEPALGHPSAVLRQAAASVRNAWYLAK